LVKQGLVPTPAVSWRDGLRVDFSCAATTDRAARFFASVLCAGDCSKRERKNLPRDFGERLATRSKRHVRRRDCDAVSKEKR
ncbi:Protein of unknown function, partial [Gryllus bimaculatus]